MRQRYEVKKVSDGLTQQQIADGMGRSQGAVGNWLAGEGSPRIDEFPRLAEILDCDVVWLAWGEPVASRYELSQAVGRLSAEQQERLIALAQVMS